MAAMAINMCATLRSKINTLIHFPRTNQSFYSPLTRRILPIYYGSEAVSSSTNQSNARLKRPFNLTFEEFQKLRRKIRTQKRISGIPFALAGLTTSSFVCVMLNPNLFDATDPEQIQPILGLDPIVFCTLCGVASSGVGFMLGSALHGVLWKWMNKDLAQNMNEREVDFFRRLDKHRTDAFSKFEDDFYGENIKNLSDYRQWARQMQRKKKEEEKFGKTLQQQKEQQTLS